MIFTKISEGTFSRSNLDSNDGIIQTQLILIFILLLVFIADTGKQCYVWVGSGASQSERRQAMSYAHVWFIIHVV